MKKIVITAAFVLVTATLLARGAEPPTQPAAAGAQQSKAHVLSRAELDKLLVKPSEVLLIDVRRPDEISKIGGLPVYLSIQLGDLEKNVAWIPKGRTIVTVSNHAKRAGTAADFLASKGFRVAGAVGVQTYEQEGGTLTRVAVPQSAQARQP